MTWLTENWFSVLIFIAFIAMHFFGHSGHGGHGGQKSRDQRGKDEAQGGAMNTSLGGHQH